MTKAEQEAIKSYPHAIFGGAEGDSIRAAFMLGFHMAESEYRITPEDIQVIINLVRQSQPQFASETTCYERVAKLFNDARNQL